MNILVIGESCRDIYRYGECSRLCPEAPVPVIKLSNEEYSINPGMAMNVYRNIVSLSNDTVEVALSTNANWESVNKIRYVDQRTNYIILRADENDDQISPCNNLDEIDFSQFEVVVISDYNKGHLSEQDIKYISQQHENTFLDTKKILGDWCSDIKYIKINEFEHNRTKHMLDDDMESKMIITLGPAGAKYLDKIYPVPKVEIKDTSGAGDTFIAALALEYAKTKDIDSAIKFANEKATAVVQKKGVSVI
jgi:D-beta-D-heptose 7-phosphate kinase/D-beta-D-heptose 1-phosphate adenosyltransferase